LQYPNTDVAKKAVALHVGEVKDFVATITDVGKRDADLSKGIALQAPAFPQAGKGGTVPSDTIPTYAFNWCVSPLTPMRVAGVIWVPSENNVGETPAHYAAELEIYAKSLQSTYGQDKVPFLYAQPASSLVEGITAPKIPDAKSVTFDQWPKSLKDIAAALAKLAD
jgi:hypothetical protein